MRRLNINYLLITTFCFFTINGLQAQQRSVISTASKENQEIVFGAGEAVVLKLENSELTLYQGFIMPLTVPTQSPSPSVSARNSLLVFPGETAEVRVWPNPVVSGGVLYVSGLTGLADIKLWTLQGNRVVSTGRGIRTGTIEIPIYEQPGLYLVEVKTSFGTVKKKIIVR